MRPLSLLLAVLLPLLLSGGCASTKVELTEKLDQGGFKPPSKERKVTSPEALSAFDARDYEEVYRLGPGDVLTLNVWGRPELTDTYRVGPDGIVTLPVSGDVDLGELTRYEAEERLQEALDPYFHDISLTMRVDEYGANRIYVLGRVEFPGVLEYDLTLSLLEAITRAGGLPTSGIASDKATLTRCAIFRGRDQLVWIDLKRLLNGDDLSLNITLKRNDVLYLPDASDLLVYVMGEVERPGAYRLTPEMSLLDALAQAGGATRHGQADRMQFIRPQSEINITIPLKELLEPQGELNVELEDGDIIYVPKKGIAKVGYVLEQVSPGANFLLLGAALSSGQ